MEEVELKPEAFFSEERERGKQIVLDAAGIDRGQQSLLVTCKVAGFTVESKAGDFNALRGYVQVVPENLYIHVLLHDPDKMVDEMDDAAIFGAVFNHVARQLDMNVVDVANRRADREIAAKDAENERVSNRVRSHGKEIKPEQKLGAGTLL